MIHTTAIVSSYAKIHPSVSIGPWCYIDGPVTIGRDSILKNNVTILGSVAIGEKNYVSSYSVIGGIPQDPKYKFEETIIKIGNSNRIHEFVTINRGTKDGERITRIGDNNIVMSYSHLGHDVSIGNNCKIASYCGISGHVKLEDYITMGGMVAVNQFVRIGQYSFITGRSILTLDVPPFSVAYGTSTKTYLRGANISGLKRKGFSKIEISAASNLLKIWSDKDISASLAQIRIDRASAPASIKLPLFNFLAQSHRGALR